MACLELTFCQCEAEGDGRSVWGASLFFDWETLAHIANIDRRIPDLYVYDAICAEKIPTPANVRLWLKRQTVGHKCLRGCFTFKGAKNTVIVGVKGF